MTVLSIFSTARTIIKTESRYFIGLAVAVACILSIPLVTMVFTGQVKWTFFDFIFMGTLLFGAGLSYKLVVRTMSIIAYRTAAGIAVLTTVVLVWINGAVGIIGDGPVNVLYAGVPFTGVIGLILARFRPLEMAYATFAMAIVQALVPVIALMMGITDFAPGVLQVFGLNSVFVILYVISGLLFRSAFRG